ncbi:hypothetical protein NDU88_005317 [Pleurodeles waltl]|uniref:Uncharacterized protein n=1 Tax=Pleurodeles waltl TaxID=8319 RepID=A0AAV7MW16_PLEWA|nr:hypothetical protein NDU88_005317 [Pleurodeles waltl]
MHRSRHPDPVVSNEVRARRRDPAVVVLVTDGEGDGVEDEYETAIMSLDVRFTKYKNVTLERHKFYKRVQAEGESASSYVGALRLLAVSSDYKEFEKEMIKDQLVEKTNNKKVQEALLSTPNLTLQKALEIDTRIESTVSFMEQMSISNNRCQSLGRICLRLKLNTEKGTRRAEIHHNLRLVKLRKNLVTNPWNVIYVAAHLIWVMLNFV